MAKKKDKKILEFNLKNFNKNQLTLLNNCYHAIRLADKNKIRVIIKNHFKADNWLEEECTPNYPEIKVRVTGISHDLYINDKSCIDETLEP
jgi:hypothetical protein